MFDVVTDGGQPAAALLPPAPAPIRTYAQAKAIAYSLSNPSKMPGYGYSLPAWRCPVGSKLVKVKGSVCHGCYALKGRYRFPKVRQAMEARLRSLTDPQWVEAMAFMINYHGSLERNTPLDYFRWHDSGDVQGLWHLEKIAKVCVLTPTVHHWLPTREIAVVKEYVAQHGSLPANIVVRISAPMVGMTIKGLPGIPVSTVERTETAVQCEAYTRGGKCGDCRACWTNVDVNYPKH